MIRRKVIVVVVAVMTVLSFVASVGHCQTLRESWGDFLHYTAIGRLDLAKGFAQALLDSNPDPVELLALSEENPQGYAILLKVHAHSDELTDLAGAIIDKIEQGRFIRRTDPEIIAQEIKRLSSTVRGRITAIERLKNAGEFAIVYMLDAMADSSRQAEFANISSALSRMGRDVIRPLVAALQTDNVAVKSEIIRALGKIGYSQSLGYLKYIAENDSSPEFRRLAAVSAAEIDPAALRIPAAELFFRLAESYYAHSDSLAPADDYTLANIWFWDVDGARLARRKVDKSYFNELMAMRACESALRADANIGKAIALWLTAYFKAESTGLRMPDYFGPSHPDAMTYATLAGAEYLHQALARAVEEKNAYVALRIIEALTITAGRKSLLYRIGTDQPLVQALYFPDRQVRYSAAMAIAAAGPAEKFVESKLVVENLAEAISQEGKDDWDKRLADSYAIRSAKVMLKLAQDRNRVLDLSTAQPILINATADQRGEIKVLAGKILAQLNNLGAQRTIAAMAVNQDNSLNVRIAAFESLATSAKLNGNLLIEAMVDQIYSLVDSKTVDEKLRRVAAVAYGSLNLPSKKVKDLILDQARI